jgi:DNA replication and repair protein RecF
MTLTKDLNPTHYISRLRLSNFRSYSSAAIDCNSSHIVLTGANGAGKTNILEAISLLSTGRGLRRAKFSSLNKIDASENQESLWAVALTIETPNGEIDIGTGATPDGARKIRINGANAKSIQELTPYIRLLWLTPDMDGLFRGPSTDRRRFFDRLVSTLIPDHSISVSQYEKAMRQRNKLLSESADDAWLNAIETQMAQFSAAIYFARIDCLGHLERLLNENIDKNAFPSSSLSLTPLFENDIAPASSSILEASLIKHWKQMRAFDTSAGRTTTGVHKTDLNVTHKQKNIPAILCSTGEQKALLVGLILAHASLVKKMTNITPILLLDEIGAHLDEKRRQALYESLDKLNCQCWMSGTDIMLFESLKGKAEIFDITNGRISPI